MVNSKLRGLQTSLASFASKIPFEPQITSKSMAFNKRLYCEANELLQFFEGQWMKTSDEFYELFCLCEFLHEINARILHSTLSDTLDNKPQSVDNWFKSTVMNDRPKKGEQTWDFALFSTQRDRWKFRFFSQQIFCSISFSFRDSSSVSNKKHNWCKMKVLKFYCTSLRSFAHHIVFDFFRWYFFLPIYQPPSHSLLEVLNNQ